MRQLVERDRGLQRAAATPPADSAAEWWSEDQRAQAANARAAADVREHWFALARAVESVLGEAFPDTSFGRYVHRHRMMWWVLGAMTLTMVLFMVGAWLPLSIAAFTVGLIQYARYEVVCGSGDPRTTYLDADQATEWATLVREAAIEMFGDRSMPGAPASHAMLSRDLKVLYTAWGEADLQATADRSPEWSRFAETMDAAQQAVDELAVNPSTGALSSAETQTAAARAAWKAATGD